MAGIDPEEFPMFDGYVESLYKAAVDYMDREDEVTTAAVAFLELGDGEYACAVVGFQIYKDVARNIVYSRKLIMETYEDRLDSDEMTNNSNYAAIRAAVFCHKQLEQAVTDG